MKNPAEVARGYLTLGKIKTEQTAVRLLLLGMLAGAFIALAGAAATFGNVYVGKVAGAAIFPAGLTMVVLAGSELFTGNCLLIIPLLEREIRLRRALCFPPICDIALISFSGSAENMVGIAGVRLLEELKKLRAEPAFSSAELLVFGPVEAPVYRVDNRYRQRIVIKCRLTRQVLSLLQSLLLRVSSGFSKQKLYFSIDLNPSSL